MNFKQFLKSNIVVLDGGMGTLLQAKGLKPGEYPERWNITHSDIITDIHQAYFDSGSNVVSTNTFGANIIKFSEDELENIIKAAVANAKNAKDKSKSKKQKFIALDIGPTGKLLKPYGDLDFEDAVSIFAKTVKLGVKFGVDLIIIETMNDSYETKAALLAVKENSDLPVFVTNAYSENGKLLTGATPAAMVALLEGMGVDALGANCSLGPKQLSKVAEELLENASVPVILKPNAGLPKEYDGKTYFDVDSEQFADELFAIVNKGVRVVGGCCGTTPEYINQLNNKICSIKPQKIVKKNKTVVSSYAKAVEFKNLPILIGERINPTGKKRFKQALINNDFDYILSEAINQQDKGVHILDVNVGLPEVNEKVLLNEVVCKLQAVVELPLQIDTSDVIAMESALRHYNGKAMINSVNGKMESMQKIFPLAKKYGSVIVALTLDENGIPATAQGRIDIAKKILKTAKEYGIDKKDIVFDTLTMAVSADATSANVTLKSLQYIKNKLGCHTVLGVSNISFGLPCREIVNSTFFALALENGLTAAIMNPYSAEMLKAYYSFNALKGLDNNCCDYISASASFVPAPISNNVNVNGEPDIQSKLQYTIIKGLKDSVINITKEYLNSALPLDIINNEIIPALNQVGVGYEEKKIFLPQLLMSAEAAKCAFDVIKSQVAEGSSNKKGTIILATVEGDIHDIGKNIVKLLLENYGFNVFDLGKDVPSEVIVQKAIELKADIVGLSALMTTTVPNMEKTIKLLRQNKLNCKIIVGGAVLTEDYAQKIYADHYAKDAMGAVRYAQEIIK